jgi:hypothetical protein
MRSQFDVARADYVNRASWRQPSNLRGSSRNSDRGFSRHRVQSGGTSISAEFEVCAIRFTYRTFGLLSFVRSRHKGHNRAYGFNRHRSFRRIRSSRWHRTQTASGLRGTRFLRLEGLTVLLKPMPGLKSSVLSPGRPRRSRPNVAFPSVTHRPSAADNHRLHRGVRFRCCQSAHPQPPAKRRRLWAFVSPQRHNGGLQPLSRTADNSCGYPLRA